MEASPSVPRDAVLARVSPTVASLPATSAAAPVRARPTSPVPAWLALAALIVIAANLLAGVTTYVTVELMHGVTPFARAARAYELSLLPYWRCLAYTGGIVAVIVYLRPIVLFFKCGATAAASELV